MSTILFVDTLQKHSEIPIEVLIRKRYTTHREYNVQSLYYRLNCSAFAMTQIRRIDSQL